FGLDRFFRTGIGRPQTNHVRILRWITVNVERRDVERRPNRLELESCHCLIRRALDEELQQQRRNQRPVDAETGVSLDLPGISPIVVNAVSVERERRESKEKSFVRLDGAAPGGFRQWIARAIGRGARHLAIHEILILLDGELAIAGERMANRDEDERSIAAAL